MKRSTIILNDEDVSNLAAVKHMMGLPSDIEAIRRALRFTADVGRAHAGGEKIRIGSETVRFM